MSQKRMRTVTNYFIGKLLRSVQVCFGLGLGWVGFRFVLGLVWFGLGRVGFRFVLGLVWVLDWIGFGSGWGWGWVCLTI